MKNNSKKETLQENQPASGKQIDRNEWIARALAAAAMRSAPGADKKSRDDKD